MKRYLVVVKTYDGEFEYLDKTIIRSAEVANYLDSKILVVHGGLISSINMVVQSREKSVKVFVNGLKKHVKKNPDLKICVENLPR